MSAVFTSQDLGLSSRSSKKPSRKRSDVIVKRECHCNPETLKPLGPGENPSGQIFWCERCKVVGKMPYEEIESISPLRFTRPLRET